MMIFPIMCALNEIPYDFNKIKQEKKIRKWIVPKNL